MANESPRMDTEPKWNFEGFIWLEYQCLATLYAVLVLLIVPSFSQVQRTPVERGFVNWFGPEHSPPLRSSNEWNSWQSWSPCSRTCGGGAAVRTRQCIKRDSAGPHCPGDTRQYQVCNMKDCPSGVTDFRQFQCSAYNNKPLMGNYYKWIPFQSGQGDCELSCLAQGQNFYYNFGRVLDGTSCHTEYNGICINGQCLKVGCDFILGSDEKTDICGVCGGQNISCQHHHNIYTTKYPASGLFGYNEVTLIPAGATNIRVTDKSNNYLALRNRNYHYVINGNWAINYPGVFDVAGTKIQYKRSADNLESFEAAGPTDEDLHVMVLFTEQNSGIEYEYWLPKEYYINHQRDRSSLLESMETAQLPTLAPTTPTPTTTTVHSVLRQTAQKKWPPQARQERGNIELNRSSESKIDGKCGKCRKVKGLQNKIRQYCQKDFVFRGRIGSKKIVGKETRYDVQVVITYKNNFPILRREYMWVPNTCDCPSLLEKREYILMARRHVNYEKTLNRILLETDSFVRLYKPKEDKMLRDLDQECVKYGYQTHPKVNQ
ncbi:ADAMTS-like protein 5 isoform X1 [Hyla sarda]|uniref:ADAMTS-like protein 5 isoform X1 n=1 Tax=Hyla sarda TaxID=327740 RepID=UPI0024C3D0C6|nr:ADAMTS-like protein 5 isoform X1 [Hyla sarda]